MARQPAITSIRQLAAALGVAASTCAGYLKRDDWPAGVPRRSPWSARHLAALKAWRQWLQEDRSGKAAPPAPPASTSATPAEGTDRIEAGISPSAKAKADALLKYHRARHAKVQADAAEGKVIPRDLLEQGLAALATMFVQVGDDVFESLPHQLDGQVNLNEPILRQAWHDWRQKIIDHVMLDLSKIDDRIAQAMRRAGGR